MTRIFFTLAWLSFVLLGAALAVGFMIGDLYHEPTDATLHWRTVHSLTGLAAALAVVLVESIVVTYFIGTSRWVKEVAETYRLDASLVARGTALKRRTFPWALMGMLIVVGIIALGGAADPSTGRPDTQSWVTPHLVASLVGMALIAWTFFVEARNIAANHQIITDVLAEVRRIREERGLDV